MLVLKKIVFWGFLIFLFSCTKDEEKVVLTTANYQLSDLGRIPFEFMFQSILEDKDVYTVKIRTKHIRTNDSINSIEAFVERNKLYIYITSLPYDSIWWNPDTTRFTIHDLNFNLYGLKYGKYEVDININNVRDKDSNFIYDFPKTNL